MPGANVVVVYRRDGVAAPRLVCVDQSSGLPDPVPRSLDLADRAATATIAGFTKVVPWPVHGTTREGSPAAAFLALTRASGALLLRRRGEEVAGGWGGVGGGLGCHQSVRGWFTMCYLFPQHEH